MYDAWQQQNNALLQYRAAVMAVGLGVLLNYPGAGGNPPARPLGEIPWGPSTPSPAWSVAGGGTIPGAGAGAGSGTLTIPYPSGGLGGGGFGGLGVAASQGNGGKNSGGDGIETREGTIYEVPGEGTPSGRPYIGRHNKPDPSKTRRSSDGRDRSQAKVIDKYDSNNVREGRVREQKAIDQRGGIPNLDNKRNEIAPSER